MVDYNDMSVEQLNEIVEEIKGIISDKENGTRKFYVDERGGCIGVRECVDYQVCSGLHSDLPDVIKVWHGWRGKNREGFVEWCIYDWQREAAKIVCDTLNEINLKFIIRDIK